MAKRSDQPASLDPVGSFQVHYRGRLASEGIVEAESFATSLLGATKLYASLVHYAGTGKILKSNSQRNFRIYTRAAEKGNSVDLELVVLAVLHATNVYAADPTLYNEITEGVKGLASRIFGQLLSRGQPDAREREHAKSLDTVTEVAKMNLERDKEITRRHEITERERTKRFEIAKGYSAIDRIPATVDHDTDVDSTLRLAEVVAPHARDFVEPVINRTVDNVVQFPEEDGEIRLAARGGTPRRAESGEAPAWQGATREHIGHIRPRNNAVQAGCIAARMQRGFRLGLDEAELIRRVNDVLTELRWYRVLEITRINPRTGNCVVLVEEWGRRVWAMINDPTLDHPNNEYTRAENLHLELDVLAQVRSREGSPPKLYIRKAKVREEP